MFRISFLTFLAAVFNIYLHPFICVCLEYVANLPPIQSYSNLLLSHYVGCSEVRIDHGEGEES
jgi:hypothetical protein